MSSVDAKSTNTSASYVGTDDTNVRNNEGSNISIEGPISTCISSVRPSGDASSIEAVTSFVTEDVVEESTNGNSTENNGVSAESNGVSAESNGVSAASNGVSAETNGVSAESNGVSIDGNGVGDNGVTTNGVTTNVNEQELIKVDNFPTYILKMRANNNFLYRKQFRQIEPEHSPKPTATASCDPINKDKNRYSNILAYDHSRVHLQVIHNLPDTEYINANFIHGNAYIATQGPKKQTVDDFWRMIWEYKTTAIVMLTNTVEDKRSKCEVYWPDDPEYPYKVSGSIVIHLESQFVMGRHVVRTLTLKTNRIDERTVRQFHFTAWPDHGVPKEPSFLLPFITEVKNYKPPATNPGPIVVHCSAGVGRTGTFIAIENLISTIEVSKTVNVFNFVRDMRLQRNNMVQTEGQYIFIHDALLEYIQYSDTDLFSITIKRNYETLCSSQYALMNTEFNRLNKGIDREPDSIDALMDCNILKNRIPFALPYDNTRCKLSAISNIEGSDYINATIIEGYYKDHTFIAAQGPILGTVSDLWRMVWEYKSSVIVMLADDFQQPEEMCCQYWPNAECQIHGSIKVTILSVDNCYSYILRRFEIIDILEKNAESYVVFHILYLEWQANSVPINPCGLFTLKKEVTRCLNDRKRFEKHPPILKKFYEERFEMGPVIVHCSDGCDRTGTYIALSLLMDRLREELLADVFQTVKYLRRQRPGIVCSLMQYDFIHKFTLQYLAVLLKTSIDEL